MTFNEVLLGIAIGVHLFNDFIYYNIVIFFNWYTASWYESENYTSLGPQKEEALTLT